MNALPPVDTLPLFRPLRAELLALLRGLQPEAWDRPTVAGTWRVRDVAVHLLDGDLRRLSATRDGHSLGSAFDLLAFVNGLNATGVAWGARLSPRLVTDLLELTGEWFSDYVATLPPHGRAAFAVSWAGEEESENWMDVGREYTERWHHQMQIREAVKAPGLLEGRWLLPLLELSVRAIPRAYAGVDAPGGTAVVFTVPGFDDAAWSVVRGDAGWTLFRGEHEAAAASVAAAPDHAWRLFFNALRPERARGVLDIRGDRALAEPLLMARALVV